MEVKDTVMNDQQRIDAQDLFIAEHPDIIVRFPLSGWMRESAMLKLQAEISFKMGYKQGIDDREGAADKELDEALEEARYAGYYSGIKEVVEQLEQWEGKINLSQGTVTFVVPMPELEKWKGGDQSQGIGDRECLRNTLNQ